MEDDDLKAFAQNMADAIEAAIFQTEKKVRIPFTGITISYVFMESEHVAGVQVLVSWRRS